MDNQPYGSIEEDLRAAAFTVHGYHHTPIGSIEDLNKATLQNVRDFFNTYYKPNNATLVIVGDFNSEQALGWTEKYFAGIPASAQPIPRRATPEPAQTAERDVKKSYTNTPLPAVVIGYKMPAKFAPDAYPLDLASNILAGGESSRFVSGARLQRPDRGAGGGIREFHRRSESILGVRNPESGPHSRRGRKGCDGRTGRIEERARGHERNTESEEPGNIGIHSRADTDEEKAVALADAAVIGKNPDLVNTELERYLAVTPADIQRVAEEYFVPQHATILFITPAAPPQ